MKTPSKLFTTFQNSFVYILTKSLRSTENIGNEDGHTIASGPVVISGFVADECPDFIYLAHEPDSDDITEAVQRSQIVRMFLPIEELASVFDGMPTGSNEGMN
jgi:hypothetical protein